jgi:hypothetical protein
LVAGIRLTSYTKIKRKGHSGNCIKKEGVMIGPIGPTELILVLFIVLIWIWPFWKIFQKAGYPGWYFIVIFIPLVNIIALFYFAFTEWPVHKALREAGVAFPPKKP